jgi:transposase
MRRHIPQRMMEDALDQRNRIAPPPHSGKARAALSLPHPNAAGIDIGSASHYLAVPPDRDDEPVREYASFNADLHRLAEWPPAVS